MARLQGSQEDVMTSEKNLLFVDDETEILEILVDLFTDDGYCLHTATRASEAMRIMDSHPIDFVLTDLKLPDSSGSDFLERVRESHPDAVRVLTSGYFDVQFGQVKEDTDNGTIYLSKPWDLGTLKNLVECKLG
jgi:DNA-binding NtrC family response regulator